MLEPTEKAEKNILNDCSAKVFKKTTVDKFHKSCRFIDLKNEDKMNGIMKLISYKVAYLLINIMAKKVERGLSSIMDKQIDEYTNKISRGATQKTIFYFLWSVVGIIWLNFTFVKPLSYFLISGLMVICVFYFLWQFLEALKIGYLFLIKKRLLKQVSNQLI